MTADQNLGPFTSSIVGYPERGRGGSAKWRGNSGPGIVEQFLLTFHVDKRGEFARNEIVADPMAGSGTTGDVAERLGVARDKIKLLDLHGGFENRQFDAVRDDLLAALNGEHAGSVFLHPQYLSAIDYCKFRDVAAPGSLARPVRS